MTAAQTIRLTVAERLALLNMLPKEGDIETIRIVHDLRKNLSFGEEEHAALKISRDEQTGSVRWDAGVEKELGPAEIPCGLAGLEVIRRALRDLNKRRAMREAYLPLWDRFVDEKA